MPEITEGHLTFYFPENYQVIKYDESEFYTNIIKRAPYGFKAVDILAKLPNDTIKFIEIKDCLGYEAENSSRFSGIDCKEVLDTKQWIANHGWDETVSVKRLKPYLPDEIAQKVIDSLMGLLASQRFQEDTLKTWITAINKAPINIVLFLGLSYTPKDYKRLAGRMQGAIRTRLNFLNINQVLVCNEHTIPTTRTWSVTRNS